MAEYIDRTNLITVTDIRQDGSEFTYISYDDIQSLPTADVVEREKIDKAIEEMKALADPENTILGFDEKMGLMTAMNILVRNIGE